VGFYGAYLLKVGIYGLKGRKIAAIINVIGFKRELGF
jgi:hypothetical protein